MTAPSLAPTWFIDADSPAVGDFARDSAAGATDPTEVAVALFHAVRDGIRYDPYGISYDPAAFRASSVVASPSNWCVPKSVLLTAAARNRGIPARLGFADVKNHLTSEKLQASSIRPPRSRIQETPRVSQDRPSGATPMKAPSWVPT